MSKTLKYRYPWLKPPLWKDEKLVYIDLFASPYVGSVAEWSKAMVLGTILFGGKSSNLFTIKLHDCYVNHKIC